MKRLADRRQRRVRRVGFWAAVTAIAAYLLFVGDQRPHHLLLLWLEDNRTEERLEALEAEREELRAEARHLVTDTLALEALARQKGMIRPGDLVYRIVPVPPDVHQAAAESLAARAARIAADSLAAAREAEAATREAERDRARPRQGSPYPRPPSRPDDDPVTASGRTGADSDPNATAPTHPRRLESGGTDPDRPERDPADPGPPVPETESSSREPGPPDTSPDPGPSDATSEAGSGALRAASPSPLHPPPSAR